MNANERVTMDVFQWLLGDITIDKNPEAEPMGKIIIMDKNPTTDQVGGAELGEGWGDKRGYRTAGWGAKLLGTSS